MKWLVLIVALGACGKSGPHATGALVFDAREAADVFLATEAEVMRSEPIVRRVREDLRVELAPSAINVKRRAGTMILDVTVHDKDPMRAAELCNELMEMYLGYRLALALTAIQQQQQVLGEQLDRDPQNTQLRARFQELDTKAKLRSNDVRVLEPCVFRK